MADKIGASSMHGLRYDSQADAWFRDAPGRELAASDVLASAARTATASSPAISTQGARGVAIRLNVTAVPGAGGDLTLRYLYIFPSGASVAAVAAGLAILRTSGASAWYLIDYPGAADVSATRFLQRGAPALPPRISIQVVHSDSESWTYSVEADLLP